MKRIEVGKAGESFMKGLKEASERKRIALERIAPDKEIVEWINHKVEETFDINNGDLDKESFRLGLYSMYFHLKPKDGKEC